MKKITYLLTLLFCTVFTVSKAQVHIGTGTYTNEYTSVPINPYYGYTYSQMIYTSGEINANGNITSLTFFNQGNLTSSTNWTIYLGHTSKTEFASTTDWIPVSGLTQVFSGTVSSNSGVIEIILDTPFPYNGSDNLVIATDENQAGHASSSDRMIMTSIGTNRSIYYISDITDPNPSSPPTASGRHGYVGNVILGGITQVCPAPSMTAALTPTTTEITLAWNAAAVDPSGGYDYYVSTSNTSPTSGATPTGNIAGGTFVTVPNLTPGTTYYAWVRSNCGTDSSSWVAIPSFTTLPTCLVPGDFGFSDVTQNTALIAWSMPAEEPQNGYEYYISTSNTPPDAASTPIVHVPSGTYTTIQGLTASTQYYVWLRSKCLGNDVSAWTPSITFSTLCDVFTVPFSEAFSNGAIPLCWTTTSTAPATNTLWKFSGAVDYATGNTRPNGTFAWVDGSTPTSSDVTLLTPLMNLAGLTHPELEFDYFSNNTSTYANNIFKVEVFDGTAWNEIFNNNTSQNTWRTITISLAAYTNATIQIRFVVDKTPAAGNAFYNDILLDNVSVHEAPTCIIPTNVSVDTVATNTATISWTASITPPANGYDYYLSTTNTPPADTETGTNVPTGTSVNLATLNSSTQYYIWIRTHCSSSDVSAWAPVATFTTLCDVFTVPFSEAFSNGAIPLCWTTTSTTPASNTLWKFTGAVDYATGNTRPNGTFAWVDGSTPVSSDVTLISPPINLAGLTHPELEFDYFSNNTGTYANNIFKVEVFNGTTWNEIFNNNTSQNTWREITISLLAYVNTTIQLRFIVDKSPAGTNAFYNDILLDNVSVHEAPTCFVPTGVTIDAITSGTATVSWTAPSIAPSNGYEYYISTTNTAPTDTSTPIVAVTTGTSASLSDLTSSTDYYIWVRSNCGTTDGKSLWTPVKSFSTECLGPVITQTTGDEICGPATATLQAVTSSGTINWYTTASSPTPLATGTSFTTPVLTETTNYYVSGMDGITGYTARLAPESTLSPNAGYTAGLTFNVTTPFLLNSVDVYLTGAAGLCRIKLQTSSGTVLAQIDANLPAASGSGQEAYTIPLNFQVPVGNGLVLMREPATGSASIGGQESSWPKPTSISAGGTQYGEIINGWWWSPDSSYWFFYNWNIGAGCEGERQMVTATVTTTTLPVGESVQIFNQGDTIDDLEVTGTGLIWYSDANATTVIPESTVLVHDAIYYVTQTLNDCESTPLAITVKDALSTGNFDEASFKYYPNPVNDVLNISYSENIISVAIYNLLGQKVINKQIDATQSQLDLSSLSQGTYIVKIITNNSKKDLKIVKK